MRSLAILAFGFLVIHAAHSQEYSSRRWVQEENQATIQAQQQAEHERYQANAKVCARITAYHPSIGWEECMADPVSANNRGIAENNAQIARDNYRAHLNYERQLRLYERQQAEYRRRLEEWRSQQGYTPY